jgi:hypothetical protein
MAVDLWPYSGRGSGAVTDVEHEYLWSGFADGILPGQPSNACAVINSGSSWTVQPGRILIAGHQLYLDTVQSGPLPTAGAATRRSIVCAYIDRSATPWAFGVQLVIGQPGSGRPSLSKSRVGLYQVPLRAFDTATNGTVTMLQPEAPVLTPAGGALVRATNSEVAQVPLLVSGASGQTGAIASFRRYDGYKFLDVGPTGRVGLNTDGAASSIGLWVKGSAATDVTLRLQRLAGQTTDVIQAVSESNVSLFNVDKDGDLKANNFEATEWTTYTPLWQNAGSATFVTRTGRWKRIGKKVVAFNIYVHIGNNGSGTTAISTTLPTAPSRVVQQTFHGAASGPGSVLAAVMQAGGSGTTVDSILQTNAVETSNVTGSDCLDGRKFNISGIYEEL